MPASRKPAPLPLILEAARWGGVGLGTFLAFGQDTAIARLHVLSLWAIVCVAGLTGLESLLFGREAADRSGYGDPGPYQRQSGLSNLSLALAAQISHVQEWGVFADAALTTAFLLFLGLSAVNHVAEARRTGENAPNTWVRPIGSAVLTAVLLPVLWLALHP